MLRRDDRVPAYAEGLNDISGWLEPLVAQDPSNRAAFEFLAAQYLIDGRIDEIPRLLGRLEQLKYTEIPTHLEEAVLLHQRLRGTLITLPAPISEQTRQNFDRFMKALSRWDLKDGTQRAAARAALQEEFGKTCAYYCYFGSAL